MVICPQWDVWKASNIESALKIRGIILDERWWVRVQYVLDITKPIMTMLYFADTDTPCLGDVYDGMVGDVYDGMDTMIEKVKHYIQAYESDPIECQTFYNKVEAIIIHRWEKMTTPLHLLAYALSSRYYSEAVLSMPDRIAPYVDEEVANGCSKAFARIFQDDEMHEKVRIEFGLFASRARFTPFAIKDQNKMGATTWWYMYGQPYKHLQPLAIKILSQVASSFAAERNWSTYSYIHSVKRNRLGSKKAKDLVYIPTNLHLLSRKDDEYMDGVAKLWDVLPKCPNLDATLRDLTMMMDDGDNRSMTHGASNASETIVGSNDMDLAAAGDEEDPNFFENPCDSD